MFWFANVVLFWFANVVVWVLGWWFVKIVILFWFANVVLFCKIWGGSGIVGWGYLYLWNGRIDRSTL